MPDQPTCEHGPRVREACFTCASAEDSRTGGHAAWAMAQAYWANLGYSPANMPSLPMSATQRVMEDLNRRVINERLRAPAVSLRDIARGFPLSEERASVGYRVAYRRLEELMQPIQQEQWGDWLAVPPTTSPTGRQPTTSRSAAMPVYPASRDPNVPGDGRPLQVGDRVIHDRGTADQVGRIVAVDGERVQVTRDGPSTARDEYAMRGTSMEHWPSGDWVLLERPQNQPSGLPPSLDPAVPGDGRPFVRGDILRHVHDPADGTVDGQLTGLLGNTGRLLIVAFGSRSGHLAGRPWSQASFQLVHRPTASEFHMQLPAPPELGTAGAYADPEFVAGVCEWLQQVQQQKVTVGSCAARQADGMVNTRPLTFSDAMFYLRCFISASKDFNPNHVVDETVRGDWAPMRGGTVANNIGRLTQGLTRLLNTWDTSISRCVTCAVAGLQRLSGSPECAHFTCDACGHERNGIPCAICQPLYVSELGYSRSCKICSTCCSHVACTEPGFEEVMLKQHQCPTCKRGPKGCKCPGCEVKGCFNKRPRECCGGCEGHCECGSMCMRHTGMKTLTHFRPPADEKGMTRLLGTEIETYGSAILKYSPLLRKAVAAWKASVITDGSIGGRGVELVTQPAGGSMWRQMIADLGAGFRESQSITAPSCGLHMHADCTDVDGFALKRIIQLYHHIEFCLYDATTIERQTGNYSRPNGAKLIKWLEHDAAKFDAKMAKGDAKRRLSYIQYGVMSPTMKIPKLGEPYVDSYGRKVVQTETSIERLYSQWDETVQQHTRGKSHANRYSGLNMHSYWLRGTLEFRMFQGTNDPEKITNWGFVIGSIVDYCVNHTDEDMTMILGLAPRLAMEVVLDGQPAVMAWLQGRWDLFTTDHKTRKMDEPRRNPANGEV